MGGVLDLPTNVNTKKGRKWQRAQIAGRETDLQGRSPMILPYNSFDIRPDKVEATHLRCRLQIKYTHIRQLPRSCLIRETDSRTAGPPSQVTTPRIPQVFSSLNHSPQQRPPGSGGLEVETTMMNNTFSSVDEAGSTKPRVNYIKRYRNEEEKLLDMLHEREATLKVAIKQGQQLRAKCNRYKEELENVRAVSRSQMTDSQWKKKYYEADKLYRDAKEELDVLQARNKNGRDILDQQKETIDVLNVELQREKLQKQQLMSQSLSSLHSVPVSDKKGRMAITQLRIDNKLLAERVNDLTVRNQRGRDYLAKIEAENRDQTAVIAQLKAQVVQERSDKEALLHKLSSLPGSASLGEDVYNPGVEGLDNMQLYAQVQKKRHPSADENHNNQQDVFHRQESLKASSGGFDDDYNDDRFDSDGDERGNGLQQHYRSATASYEEIDFNIDIAKVNKEDDSDDEVRIEAEIEPDVEENVGINTSADSATLRAGGSGDNDDVDGGSGQTFVPYEPKSLRGDDVVTKF